MAISFDKVSRRPFPYSTGASFFIQTPQPHFGKGSERAYIYSQAVEKANYEPGFTMQS
jgi:hypothetical protein